MDGFTGSTGIVVLAATNRPDVLDPALLRPGRFDRRIVVPLPNVSDRTAILTVHCSGKPLDPELNLNTVARKTPGFSGADLANLTNESAIEAVRAGRTLITADDFEAARDRIILGRREGSNVLLLDEKQRVAVHESGHALVAALSEHADPVDRITILPAGEALGATEQLPVAERHLQSESALRDILATQLGGRAAERVVYGEGSTGASNDLAAATALATRMVREFGFSTKLDPVGYPAGEDVSTSGTTFNRPFAEATQRIVDSEVARLLREAEECALDLLATHRPVLDSLCSRLVEAETLDGAVVYELLRTPSPSLDSAGTLAAAKAVDTATSAS
jgi:cell division protease FtsH